MIIESILIVAFALSLDFAIGDPRSKYHPTAWVGSLIAKVTPLAKNTSPNLEKFGGVILVLSVCSIIATILMLLDFGLKLITVDWIALVVSIVIGTILLKTTIAIRSMEKHAIAVVDLVSKGDLDSARGNLAMIVKRDTKDLDKNHILSAVLESVSENTVDGVTGPLFYFALFGLPGAFVYRTINTLDSMIGYKNKLFENLGWFSASCDKVLNYIPARLTAFVMVLSSIILGIGWKSCYQTMIRDARKTQSPNAGYPMAALAGALGTKFEKIDHYILGNGESELKNQHIYSAISLMKVTSILFCGIITVPIIVVLSYLGWWLHA